MILVLLFLVFAGILAGSVIYLSRRFKWFFNARSARPFYILFTFLTLYMNAGIAAFSAATYFPGSLLYIIAVALMGVLLYLLLSVMLIHLLQLLVRIPGKLQGFLALSMTLIITLMGIWNAYTPRVTEVEVRLEGLDKEIRAVHLSDIHIGHLIDEGYLQKIVDKSREQDPEMVIITGDLFDGKNNLDQSVLKPLRDFKVPVYFVEGNHDNYAGIDKVTQLLKETGVRVLENELVLHEDLQIIGLKHMIPENWEYRMHVNAEAGAIQSVLAGIEVDPMMPAILLHHSPDGIPYAHEKGIDLFLAGHTHGGQIFPVTWIGELMFGYNKGLDDYKGTKIFVSQGAGTWGPPMRVGTRSEIALIKLIPTSD